MLNIDDRLEVKRMIIDSIESCIKGERKRLAQKIREFIETREGSIIDPGQDLRIFANLIETEDK